MVDTPSYTQFTYQEQGNETGALWQQPSEAQNTINQVGGQDWTDNEILVQLGGWVKTASALVGGLVKTISQVIDIADDGHPLKIVQTITPVTSLVGPLLELLPDMIKAADLPPTAFTEYVTSGNVKRAWQWMDKMSFGTVYRGMLEVGLGLNTEEWPEDAQRAVNTTDTMLGFSFIMPFICAGIGTVGNGLLGDRWTHAWEELGTKIAEEMGLSWALGTQIEEAYRAAVGTAQEEAINREKRGNRIGWPQIRTLATQHHLPQDKAIDLLKNSGFPDEQIKLLLKINDAQLAVSDISQLWYRDNIDDDTAKKYIAELGFGPGQVDHIFNLYMAKSENSASAAYRTVARQMFTRHIITEEQYRTILGSANYPQKLIDADVAAILLEQELGTVVQAVTVIKSLFQHNHIGQAEAATRLRALNYSESYIGDLIQTWGLQPLHRQHQLSQAKVLSYYVSGILERKPAFEHLTALGLNTDDANLLLDHPTTANGVRQHIRTPGLVVTAFVDGAIQPSDLTTALKSAGVQDRDIPYYTKMAQYRLSHRKGSPSPTQEASTADVKGWQKAGLVDFQSAVAWYEHLGWSPEEALLIAEEVNKGPYQPPQPSPFSNPAAAVAFLMSRGVKVFAPPDPMLQAAENMAASAGYSFEFPPSFFNQTPIGGNEVGGNPNTEVPL